MPTPGARYFGGTYTRSGVPRRGIFAAVDVKTNRLAWRRQLGDMCYAGSVFTRGGLVFIGRNDGRLTALDKANGDQLCEFEADAGIHAAVSTFEHEGQQHVVAFVGAPSSGHQAWRQHLDVRLDGGLQPPAPSGDPSSPADALEH